MPSSPSLFPGLLGVIVFVCTLILTGLWGIWGNISPFPAWDKLLLSFASQGSLKFIGLITKVMINKIGLQWNDSEGPARAWSIVAYINISFLTFCILSALESIVTLPEERLPLSGLAGLSNGKGLARKQAFQVQTHQSRAHTLNHLFYLALIL